MHALVLLVGAILSRLREVIGVDVCPGDWAWTTTMFGVLVGSLPTTGALAVALLRRRTGPGYPLGTALAVPTIALVSCGLLPLLAFEATGRLFRLTASGAGRVLDRSDRVALAQDTCLGVSQQAYLGSISVSDALTGGPVRAALFAAPLVFFPVGVAMLVWMQGRLALRRGPRWPSRFFWLPVLLLALLTGPMPAGASAQLWTGMLAGSLVGVLVVLLVPPPPRASAALRKPPRANRPRGSALRPVPARPATSPAAIPSPRLPATLVGHPTGAGARFELVRRLGAGGFGGVWLAMDHVRGHQVALKAAHAPDPDTEQRIRREARALGAVRHPSCVQIFDLVDSRTDPGLAGLHGLVIVMEYLDGCSLGELIHRRGPLDEVTVARTWLPLADALSAAHHQGVLHRDVKPANVLIDPVGAAHLIDFGIARARGDATLTLHGFVLGTPDYLAPEVARGEPASPASDGWQLAATMSFALTGRPPRGGHQDAMSGLRAAASATPPSHLPTGGAHRGLLRACLAPAPADRPSLDAVRDALQRWLVGAGTDRHRPDTVRGR